MIHDSRLFAVGGLEDAVGAAADVLAEGEQPQRDDGAGGDRGEEQQHVEALAEVGREDEGGEEEGAVGALGADVAAERALDRLGQLFEGRAVTRLRRQRQPRLPLRRLRRRRSPPTVKRSLAAERFGSKRIAGCGLRIEERTVFQSAIRNTHPAILKRSPCG